MIEDIHIALRHILPEGAYTGDMILQYRVRSVRNEEIITGVHTQNGHDTGWRNVPRVVVTDEEFAAAKMDRYSKEIKAE